MASGLSRRVETVVAYPPLSEMSDKQRREFREALRDADIFEDLPGKWQAAILQAEHSPAAAFVSSTATEPTQSRTGRRLRTAVP
jgi:hypothetical protein